MTDPNQRLTAWQTTSPFPLSASHRGISGESFALVAKALLDKWAARGLDSAVLAGNPHRRLRRLRADAVGIAETGIEPPSRQVGE
ncbi:MAG: hypothetical protein NTX53_14960 [candidate division WOR-3 bacterium]|nr:hypothetical protein [candidate division WOR-3 bacterium]